MAEITKVAPLPNGRRPESGPMQFGDDWPGLFIRGDDAFGHASALEYAVSQLRPDQTILRKILRDLIEILLTCRVSHD